MAIPSGTVVSEHRAKLTTAIVLTVLWLTLFGGIGAMFAFVVATGRDAGTVRAIGFALLALTALLTWFTWWQQSGVHIFVREDGVERKGRFGHKGIKWDEVAEVKYVPFIAKAGHQGGLVGVLVEAAVDALRKSPPKLTSRTLQLFDKGGNKVVVANTVRDGDKLIDGVIGYTTQALAPAFVQRYESGERLQFGKNISLVKGEGITVKAGLFGSAETLPWEGVEAVGHWGVELHIRAKGKKGAWKSPMMAAIPNVFVLENLVAHASGLAAQHAAAKAAGGGIENAWG